MLERGVYNGVHAGLCRIEIVGEDGIASDLKERPARLEGEANEESMLSKRALRAFLKKQVEEAEFLGIDIW